MQDYTTHKQAITAILASHQSIPGNLLLILHAIQDAVGYIPEESVPTIANSLNQSVAEIHGVISFYHYFRQTPPGENTIRICRAESCQAMHGKALEKYAQKQLNINWHETTPDGQFSLEPYYCLGNCACSPAISVNNEVYGRVTPKRFDEVIASYQGTTK